jgi:hypothetical protein
MNRCSRKRGYDLWRYYMRIMIQKFGGTSVSTPERRSLAVEKIIKARN